MAKRGRPIRFDPVKQREFCAMVSLGCTREDAARYVGCSTRTVRHRAMHDGQFRQALRSAETAALVKPLRTVERAAASNWRAAAWLLERTQPHRFARPAYDRDAPEILREQLRLIAETIVAEVADPAARLRIKAVVQRMVRNAAKEESAAADPLVDGKKRPRNPPLGEK